MNNYAAAVAALVLSTSTVAAAQAPSAPSTSPSIAPVATPSTSPITPPDTSSAVLRVGTQVPLKLLEELTTKGKKLRVGTRFHMETAEAVVVNSVAVIPAGAPAIGEITEVRNKGMWGKSGHLTAAIRYVTVNGRPIRLSGGFDDKGVTGTAGVVGAVAFVPVAGFFMTGTSAKVPLGTTVMGFVDEDVPLAMAAQAPAPLAVPVPATPVPVASGQAAPTLTPVSAVGSK